MSRTALLLALGMTLGCVNARLGDLSVMSSKNIGMTSAEVIKQGVAAKDCRTRPFPLTGPPYITPSVEDAADRAIEQADGANGLTNAVIHLKAWNAILVAQWCFHVKGDAVRIE